MTTLFDGVIPGVTDRFSLSALVCYLRQSADFADTGITTKAGFCSYFATFLDSGVTRLRDIHPDLEKEVMFVIEKMHRQPTLLAAEDDEREQEIRLLRKYLFFAAGDRVQIRKSDGWYQASVVDTYVVDASGRAHCYLCKLDGSGDNVFIPRDRPTHILEAFDGGKELRFGVGEEVACVFESGWKVGRVVSHWWEDPDGSWWPYQVRLNDGSLIYAPSDDNESICTVADAEKWAEKMQAELIADDASVEPPVLVASKQKTKQKKKKKKKKKKKGEAAGEGPPGVEAIASNASSESVEEPNDEPSDDENDGCVVCFEADKTHLSAACGHLCVCERCSAKLTSCPFCRVPCPQWIRVFHI